MSGHGQVVCVTGASGFIASWLVKLLLLRGYTVHATVRDPNDQKKVEHLLGLEGAKERLHLFKANLMEEGSFDSAISGCHGVFHTASPVPFAVNDPQADLIDPAIKGTINVLTSCKKFSSIKRVVLTSSMAAVLFTGKPQAPEVVVDESWFSDPELCKEPIMSISMWYRISKTLAEDAAWKFCKENGIEMISMNPGMVIGPMLQPTLNGSMALFFSCVNGAKTFPNAAFGLVHVKDVATAHILAFEVPSASGRYVLVETVAHFSEVVRILQELYPSLPLPDKCADDKPFAPTYQVSKEKVKSLGISYTPFEVTLKETVQNLMDKGLLSFKCD
ncbi:tetraketide alpha-pyrone reductase 1-like [Chenopodium quinoa]|uniref:tetraketide alpha-pyrone reductase 1-like n=1 Tax=Chenopodium quinoa TaxID=63459 RepID=UPI000B79052A|nr:tetraketide alpha-pyrone reductase 1-like [Chenopodium quinoa]